MYFIAFKQQEAHFSQFSGPSFFFSTHSRGSKGLSRHDLQVDERAAEISGNLNFLAVYDPGFIGVTISAGKT